MAGSTTLNPQKSQNGYSSLRELAIMALKQFGDFSASRTAGDSMFYMIDAANQVLEVIMTHPYWDKGEVSYYKSLDDIRPVPDQIIKSGILAWYALDQGSKKAQTLGNAHFSMMNLILYRLKFGTGNVSHEMENVDKDANGYSASPDHSPPSDV
jgi:hypothetical protein